MSFMLCVCIFLPCICLALSIITLAVTVRYVRKVFFNRNDSH